MAITDCLAGRAAYDHHALCVTLESALIGLQDPGRIDDEGGRARVGRHGGMYDGNPSIIF